MTFLCSSYMRALKFAIKSNDENDTIRNEKNEKQTQENEERFSRGFISYEVGILTLITHFNAVVKDPPAGRLSLRRATRILHCPVKPIPISLSFLIGAVALKLPKIMTTGILSNFPGPKKGQILSLRRSSTSLMIGKRQMLCAINNILYIGSTAQFESPPFISFQFFLSFVALPLIGEVISRIEYDIARAFDN